MSEPIVKMDIGHGRSVRVEESSSGYDVIEHRGRTTLEDLALTLTLGAATLFQDLDKTVATYRDKDDAIDHAKNTGK